MSNIVTVLRKKIKNDDRSIFFLVSIFITVILSFAKMANDDIAGMHLDSGTITDYWQKAIDMYSTWASRVLINFFVFMFADDNTIWWAISIGISIYMLMYAISTLFVNKNAKTCNIFIASMVLLYPFYDLTTAGWIATTTTYFIPTAFGFFCLIPIKKIAKQETFKLWEYLLFSVTLIYATNNEQVMVIVLGCYASATIYFLFLKKCHVFCIVQLVLSFLSCGLILLCPGNQSRKKTEIIRWYPSWNMLGKIDKAELGYSTTMEWLFFGNNIFIITIYLLFLYIIWQKYKNNIIRMIALIPAIFTIAFGPFKVISNYLFPSLTALTSPISQYGLVTAANRGDLESFGKYAVWGVLLLFTCIELILLAQKFSTLLISITIIGAGTASRLAVGFSPTIFASRYRTCEVMAFCIIAVACMIYSQSLECKTIPYTINSKILFIMQLLLILSMLNFLFLVATLF